MSKINTASSLQIPLLFLIILTFHGNSQTIEDQEHTILLKIRHHWLNPPSLNHWTPSSNSKPNNSHCDWPEITCTNGTVTGLQLSYKDLTGTIPPFICDLKNLTHLNLTWNNIPGPFPTVLYNCSRLKLLDISQNLFVGLIPGDVNRLSPWLQSLNLCCNNFSGDIPPAIGQFPELRSLELYQNQFKGSFPPDIGSLSKLERLDLSFNEFAPMAIPPSFTQLKKLKQLFMRDSRLIGDIPETIGNLTALEFLDLPQNNLSGSIPSGLFLLKNLTTLYLFKNRLSGVIPQSVEALKLGVIDLSENNLTGTIPDDFGRLTELYGLALFLNQLSGEVPASIGRLPSLKDLRLFSNSLSGVLPPDLGRYSMLTDFQVSSNRFTGTLPEYLCAKGVLITLVAYDNNLSGELPNSLGNCSSLPYVHVQGNRFSGNIPAGLWTSFNLKSLKLSDNSFTGQLPTTLATNLSRLEISNNKFSGAIPAGLSSLKSLTVFNASNNLFRGTIPKELTGLPLLETLLLDGNQLSGHLPTDIVSSKSLTSLNLSRNQLSGPIPAKLGSLTSLNFLDLSWNEFSGQIPAQIGLLSLNSLNLSSNRLTGRIPAEFEHTAFDTSFFNNSGLCASTPSLGLEVCSSGSHQNSTSISPLLLALIIASIAGVLSASAMLFAVSLIRTCRRKEGVGLDSKWEFIHFQILDFNQWHILRSLTENNVIGSGGSGKVYRVPLNHAGGVVAVKRIWNTKKLDQKLEKQFQAEVQILGTIRHANIVKLLCCISSDTSKLLVYEYSENRSLDRWLHRKKPPSFSSSVHHVVLDWPKRLQIAVGAARGLCYMHRGCSPSVIHRDVKSSNILLDSEFNAKIADFGLAKILVKHGESNSMSAVAGSFGYIAPEYAHTSRVNEKIDVYSFGVVLLELVTGRKANDGDEDMCLAEWAWHHIQEGKPIVDAMDEEVKEPCFLDEMTCVFELGIICTGTLPSNRPSMKDVLQILLRCSRQPDFGDKDAGSEYPALRMLDEEDGSLVYNV